MSQLVTEETPVLAADFDSAGAVALANKNADAAPIDSAAMGVAIRADISPTGAEALEGPRDRRRDICGPRRFRRGRGQCGGHSRRFRTGRAGRGTHFGEQNHGGTKTGDGCSARCQLEVGFKCKGVPSVCTQTVCGDGVQEGAETCDDGNRVPFDGCSATCQAEPACAEAGCTSKCGDGLLIGEECDDGNTTSGDGCSAACQVEPGFRCSQITECDKIAGKCVLHVPALFRDFQHTHSDFEQAGCGSQTPTPGIVETKLGANGKPVLVANGPKVCIASATSFAEWYTDTANNSPIVGELVLFDNGKGGFVNRWGASGEQWNESGTPLDGTPFFFPVDKSPKALVDTRYDAATGPPLLC